MQHYMAQNNPQQYDSFYNGTIFFLTNLGNFGQVSAQQTIVRGIPAQQRRGHSLTTCNTSPPAKIVDGFWKYVKHKVIVSPEQLLLRKFFDSIIPSLRTSKIQNGHQRASKSNKYNVLIIIRTMQGVGKILSEIPCVYIQICGLGP